MTWKIIKYIRCEAWKKTPKQLIVVAAIPPKMCSKTNCDYMMHEAHSFHIFTDVLYVRVPSFARE